MRKLLLLSVLLVVATVVATFAVRNSQVVEVDYYLGVWEGELIALLLITFSIGMIFSALMMSISLVKHRARAARANRRLVKLGSEFDELKAFQVEE